jgi:protein-disulfide isomerase
MLSRSSAARALGVLTVLAPFWVSLSGCGRSGEPASVTTTTTTVTTTLAATPAALGPDGLKALEAQPASTPPLADAVAPPAPPYGDLPGVAGPSPAFGPPDAPVRVYVFTDFQCPMCRRSVEPLKLLVRTHPEDVRLIVKHTASPLHRDAARAAAASIAAFRQGRFWAYHDVLFRDRGLDEASLLAAARASQLDIAQWQHDLAHESVTAQVAYETALAGALDLASTPSFVVNGYEQRGWGSYQGLAAVVARELVRAREIAAEGVPAERVAYEATRRSGERGPALAAALFEQAG